jgi:sterol desaturase/sphingolipid hydroxylase (fatty acid hydroxylase superfamily)
MITTDKRPRSTYFIPEAGKAFLLFLMLVTPLIIIAYSIKSSVPSLAYSLLLFSGWFAWTFIEYFNHRFRMHGSGDPSKVIGYERHMLHHHHPTEIKITGVQRTILFAGNIGLLIFCIIYKNWILIFTGFYSGFVIYTLMHWFLHRRISEKLFPEVHRFHIHHHCKHPDKCFGVTVTWWDHLLDTIPYEQKEVTDRIKAFYYKEEKMEA